VDAVIVLDLESVPDVDHSAVEDTVRRTVARISERLPSYQRIQNIHFWTAELPRTSTLKVKRHELAASLRTRELPETVARQASAPTSRTSSRDSDSGESSNDAWLYETLARLTNQPLSRVGPEANLLLDLGVDSLMKVELLSEIETRYGFKLPEQVAARIGRVSDLSALIANRCPVNGDARAPAARRRLLAASDASEGGEAQYSVNGRTPLMLRPLRWAVRGGVGAFFHSWVRVERRGLEHVPEEGAFLLAANHCSHLDSAAVLTAIGPALRGTGRRVYVAGAEDYFFNTRLKAAVFGGLLDTIPFDRRSDGVDGLRRCAQVLRSGQPLLIFPEGTRSVTGRMQPFKTGAVVLAAETSVPIVPVRIDRTYELLPKGNRLVRPGTVTVSFAAPMPPIQAAALDDLDARYATYRAMARELQSRVVALGRREHRDHV
jgi:long-chain acyl-CoA synthetase